MENKTGLVELQSSPPSRLCNVLEEVYILPQLLSHSHWTRLACLLTSNSKQLRLDPQSGMIRYVVPRGKAHCPNERLEIDLSFLHHLRRNSRTMPLIRHCEMEARDAFFMLDILMQQFCEAQEASGVQGTEDWSYYAYAHENLPHVPAQVTPR